MVLTTLLAVTALHGAPIVNGEPATAQDLPKTGALLIDAPYHSGGQEFRYAALLCSSTLLAPDTVLLTAHCVDIETTSGGAILLDEAGDSLRVVGVASQCVPFSGCEEDGVWNVRVGAFRDWIDQEMRDRCADGTRAWCELEGLPEPDALDTGLPDDTAVAGDPPKGWGCATPARSAAALLALLASLAVVVGRRDPEISNGL